MAIYRPIHISFWQDKDILRLTPEQKYFYLYLLTNSKTRQCGIFDLPKNLICFETGYNLETVNKLLQVFIDLKKIYYDEGNEEIFIVNWLKYNPINSRNILNCVVSELQLLKSISYLSLFEKLLKEVNKGMGRESRKEGDKKIYYDVDFTLELLEQIKPLTSPLQAPIKGMNASTETESSTETKTTTPTEPPTETKEGVAEKTPLPNLQTQCKEVFESYYLATKGINYYYDSKQAGALRDVIKKIKGVMNNKNPANDEVLMAFQMIVENINDAWVLDNLEISTINSQFNKIISKIKHGEHSGKGFVPNPNKWERIKRELKQEQSKAGQSESSRSVTRT